MANTDFNQPIQNERDKLLRLAVSRTVAVDPPGAVIIPGYTGIVVVGSNRWFAINNQETPGFMPDRTIITAELRGIPAILAPQVVWTINQGTLTNTGDNMVKILDAVNWTRTQVQQNPYIAITASILYGGVTHTATFEAFIMTG